MSPAVPLTRLETRTEFPATLEASVGRTVKKGFGQAMGMERRQWLIKPGSLRTDTSFHFSDL